mmetsp:Transcript_35400/g.36066  ORF Transcript_35400/g.36066 Transcript_35400/m.36066 type:complete len:330 (+) Transcript_35400:103-1092(+)
MSYTKTQKAYKNQEFLQSAKARNIRILCEYEETYQRLKHNRVKASILFFGSARAKSSDEYLTAMIELEDSLSAAISVGDNAQEQANRSKIERLIAGQWMCDYYDRVVELSKRFTEWSMDCTIRLADGRQVTGVSRYISSDAGPKGFARVTSRENLSDLIESTKVVNQDRNQNLVVCTGGGPGFMEAANKGASLVPGARNMGMGITLPFEEGLNPYVTEDLAFEFHYFFTRKFWMVYSCQALIVAPGGVGTMDELFEVLTLKQTGKVQKDLPVVLFGTKFWREVVNWEALVRYGTVSQSDYDNLFFTDSVDDAFKYVTDRLLSETVDLNG